MRSRAILRLSALLLAAAMTVQLCGCASIADIQNGESLSQIIHSVGVDIFGEEEQEYTQVSVALPRHPGYAAIEDKTAYASLRTEEERQAYRSMELSAFRVTAQPGEGEGTYQLCRAQIPNLTSVQIFKVKEAVLADHPEAFWLNGDYALGRNAHDGLYIILLSSMSAEQIVSRAEALSGKVSAILREIQSGLNEYDREMIIHNCIVRDARYDEETAANVDSNTEAATVYGTLVNGRAICTGYARTVKLLLNRVGISCMTVKGVCRDEGHMWNLVSVEGEWYHLDVTWNDPTEFNAYDMLSHNYFNLTDVAISANHYISPDYIMMTESSVENQDETAQNFYNFDLPECTSEEANFYSRNAVYVNRLDSSGENLVVSALRRNSRSGRDMMYIVFPDGMDPLVLEDWLNRVMTFGMDTVNAELAQSGGQTVSTYRYSSITEDNWCCAYIFKLFYDTQPISQ